MSENPDADAFRRLERGSEFLLAVEKLAGYRSPNTLESLFDKAHHRAWMSWMNESITPSPRGRKWHLHVSQHLEEVRQATGALFYHVDNVARIESELDALIDQFRDAPPALDEAGRFYPGVTSKLSFEYHAFAFCAVRIMNHLALAAGWLFGKRCPHLLSLQSALTASAAGNFEADRLLKTLGAHKADVDKLFSHGELKSVRDRIAHDEFLFAGSLWIVKGKACQLGTLKPDFETVAAGQQIVYRLSELMRSQMAIIESVVVDVVTLIDNMLPRIDGR